MNREEQKPEDLLEREIKEETRHFLVETKEEPFDEEYFEQTGANSYTFQPNSAQNINFESANFNGFHIPTLSNNSLFKQESFQSKKETKEKIEVFSERIKKETLDETHFEQDDPKFDEIVEPWLKSNSSFFNMSNDEFSSSSSHISKQEPVLSKPNRVVPVDAVKRERNNEFVDGYDCDLVQPQTKREKKEPRSLNEKYIEQETNNISEKIKEEPSQERFSNQIVLKLEQFIYPCSPSTSPLTSQGLSRVPQMELKDHEPEDVLEKEIKQEVDYLMEKIKGEPSEKDYYEQNITNDASISNCIPAVRNNHISELSNDASLLPSQHGNFGNLEQEPINSVGSYRCPVCSQIQSWKHVKLVKIEEDKLMIMVGYILTDKFSYDQALSFLTKKERMFICYSHFSEVMDDISKHLNIKKSSEIASCSDYSMNILMNIADHLRPPGPKWSLRKNMKSFFWRNRNFFRTKSPVMPLNKEPIHKVDELLRGKNKEEACVEKYIEQIIPEHEREQRFEDRCSLCTRLILFQNIKHVTLEDDKLILIIGFFLRGSWYTLEEAKSLMNIKFRMIVCHVHFSEAIHSIYRALQIEVFCNISLCSPSLMKSLMGTVNVLKPSLNDWQFLMILNTFSEKNEVLNRSTAQQAVVKEQRLQELNENVIRVYGKTESTKQGRIDHRCSICLQIETPRHRKYVTLKEERLVIIVGCVLRGDCTLEHARQIYNTTTNIVCLSHFSDAYIGLFKALNMKRNFIKNPHEIFSCSQELLKNVMDTATALRPRFTPWLLGAFLIKFFAENKHLI